MDDYNQRGWNYLNHDWLKPAKIGQFHNMEELFDLRTRSFWLSFWALYSRKVFSSLYSLYIRKLKIQSWKTKKKLFSDWIES